MGTIIFDTAAACTVEANRLHISFASCAWALKFGWTHLKGTKNDFGRQFTMIYILKNTFSLSLSLWTSFTICCALLVPCGTIPIKTAHHPSPRAPNHRAPSRSSRGCQRFLEAKTVVDAVVVNSPIFCRYTWRFAYVYTWDIPT